MASCQDLAQEQERYVKMTADPQVLEQVFLDLFFVLRDSPPRQLFIDLDVTDDERAWAAGIGVFQPLLR